MEEELLRDCSKEAFARRESQANADSNSQWHSLVAKNNRLLGPALKTKPSDAAIPDAFPELAVGANTLAEAADKIRSLVRSLSSFVVFQEPTSFCKLSVFG